MILSMTGFGRGVAASDTRRFTAEVKSLNSKQLDFSMRAPSYLKELEVETRNIASAMLERGKVDLSVTVEQIGAESAATFNVPLMQNYKAQIETMGASLGLESPQDWYSLLLRLPDSMRTETSPLSEEDTKACRQAIADAFEALIGFRATEGAKLYGFLRGKVEAIGRYLGEVDPYESERVPRIRQRLEEQLQHLDSIDFDKGRLEQELIFYIEKLDVNEEKQRLRSHLDYFVETLGDETTPPVRGLGKKLGFIAQEMGREINTLGSKSNHAQMQKIVVNMKDELEQIKEQVLNVL
ncbi:MAG: YicC family protein [Muribaculum sp.]|nr:YicC family protein [Muribaculum sp.]